MPSEPIEYFISYYKPDDYRRHFNMPEELYCRHSIGKLTDEQVVNIKKNINLDNIPDFYLQSVNELSISSPKDKPAHLKAIEKFNEGAINLELCSENYCKLTGDLTGVTKSSIDLCETCEHFCDRSCDWYTVCIHPIFRNIFPASNNFQPIWAVLDTPISKHLDLRALVQFRHSVLNIRHIVVMCELKRRMTEFCFLQPDHLDLPPTLESISPEPEPKLHSDKQQRETIKNKVNEWYARHKNTLSSIKQETADWLFRSQNDHRGMGWDKMARQQLGETGQKKQIRNLSQKMRKRCEKLLTTILNDNQ